MTNPNLLQLREELKWYEIKDRAKGLPQSLVLKILILLIAASLASKETGHD